MTQGISYHFIPCREHSDQLGSATALHLDFVIRIDPDANKCLSVISLHTIIFRSGVLFFVLYGTQLTSFITLLFWSENSVVHVSCPTKTAEQWLLLSVNNIWSLL
jgi:hypothetical protein